MVEKVHIKMRNFSDQLVHCTTNRVYFDIDNCDLFADME